MVVIAVTLFIANSYSQNTRPVEGKLGLSLSEVNAINSININASEIPPWIIAQLLHQSSDLKRELTAGRLHVSPMERNELMADPERYRGKVIALKAVYVKSSDVKEPLELAPDEQCWSVLLLDVKYCHALQLFTSENPERFRKNQLLYVVGVFLTTRVDQPEKGDMAQPIIVPVLIGTLLPIAENEKKSVYNEYSQFIVIIIVLTMLYILVRIYVGRKLKEKPLTGFHR